MTRYVVGFFLWLFAVALFIAWSSILMVYLAVGLAVWLVYMVVSAIVKGWRDA